MSPVAKLQQWLLGFQVGGKYYQETCLPFGLSTSPFLFNIFSEAFHWILESNSCGPISTTTSMTSSAWSKPPHILPRSSTASKRTILRSQTIWVSHGTTQRITKVKLRS